MQAKDDVDDYLGCRLAPLPPFSALPPPLFSLNFRAFYLGNRCAGCGRSDVSLLVLRLNCNTCHCPNTVDRQSSGGHGQEGGEEGQRKKKENGIWLFFSSPIHTYRSLPCTAFRIVSPHPHPHPFECEVDFPSFMVESCFPVGRIGRGAAVLSLPLGSEFVSFSLPAKFS